MQQQTKAHEFWIQKTHFLHTLHPSAPSFCQIISQNRVLILSIIEVKQYHYRPGQAQRIPVRWGSQISWQSTHEGGKVVRPTCRPPLPPGSIPGTRFHWRLSQPQGHSAAGRIVSMRNSNDTIGNRTRDLSACSVVPQPTAPPRAPTVQSGARNDIRMKA